jgi:hypothetical protein
VRKDERADAPLRFSAPEIIVACGGNGDFYAAVFRTGYTQARARREIFVSIQTNDCASGIEAFQKLYVVSQSVLNQHRTNFSASAWGPKAA